MSSPVVGIIVLIVVVFAIVLARAALESGAQTLHDKLSGRSEDKRRHELLDDPPNAQQPSERKTL